MTHKSYTIHKDSLTQTLRVKGSHWVPGYTPAHKATPLDALRYEVEKLKAQKAEIKAKEKLLTDLWELLVADSVYTAFNEGYAAYSNPIKEGLD